MNKLTLKNFCLGWKGTSCTVKVEITLQNREIILYLKDCYLASAQKRPKKKESHLITLVITNRFKFLK